MAEYLYKGTTYVLPDTMSEDEAVRIMMMDQPNSPSPATGEGEAAAALPPSTPVAPTEAPPSVDPMVEAPTPDPAMTTTAPAVADAAAGEEAYAAELEKQAEEAAATPTVNNTGYDQTATAKLIEDAKKRNQDTIDPDDLQHDTNWLVASQLLYTARMGKPFQGTRQELAQWSFSEMAESSGWLTSRAIDVAQLYTRKPEKYTDEQWKNVQISYAYLMNTYSDTSWNLESVKEHVLGAVFDPTSIGLIFAGGVPRVAAALGSKEVGKRIAARLVFDALGGASQTAASNYLEQSANVLGDLQDEVSLGQVGTAAVIGGTIGAVGGQVVDGGAKLIGKGFDSVADKFRKVTPDVKVPVTPDVPIGKGVINDMSIDRAGVEVEILRATEDGTGYIVRYPNGEESFTGKRTIDIAPEPEAVQPGLTPDGTNMPPSAEQPLATPPVDGQTPRMPDTPPFDPVIRAAEEGIAAADGTAAPRMPDTPPFDPNATPAAPPKPRMYDEGVDLVYKEGKVTQKGIKEGLGVSNKEASSILKRLEDDGIVSKPDPKNRNRRSLLKSVDEVRAAREADAAATPRVPEIDLPDILAKLKDIAPDMVRDVMSRSPTQLAKQVTDLTDLLARARINTLADVEELFTRMGMGADQRAAFFEAVQKAQSTVADLRSDINSQRAKATDIDVQNKLGEQWRELGGSDALLGKINRTLASEGGAFLNLAKEADLTGDMRGWGPEDLMRKDNFDPILASPEVEMKYQQKFDDLVKAEAKRAINTQKVQKLTQSANAAAKRGDFATARKRLDEIEELEAMANDSALTKLGVPQSVVDGMKKRHSSYMSFMINNMFSMSTLQNVGASTLGLSVLSRGFRLIGGTFVEQAAFTRTMGNFYGMWFARRAMIERARGSFRFQQNLLTGRNSDYGSAGVGMQGKWLSKYPIFSRSISAIDGFVSEAIYTGNIYGEALAQATIAAQRLPKGERKAFVAEAVQRTLAESKDTMEALQKIKVIRREGITRGMTGDTLDKWIEIQIQKNPAYFTVGNNKTAIGDVEDVLLNAEFKTKKAEDVVGKAKGSYLKVAQNAVSYAAYGAERALNGVPLLKVVLQPFFNTAVRAAEMGTNLSAFNFLNPKFLADIAGKNGVSKQSVAIGIGYTSYAFLMTGMLLYSQGKITGGNAKNPQDRYKYITSDGDEFEYKFMEPLATPFKFVANYLEKAELLQYRIDQGEVLDDTVMQSLQNRFGLFMESVGQTYKDFGLFSAPEKLYRMWTAVQNNDGGFWGAAGETWDQIKDVFSDTGRTQIPSTYAKTAAVSDVNTDPKTFLQKLISRVDPEDPMVPKRYNSLHIPVTPENPQSPALLGFKDIRTDAADKRRGMSDKAVELTDALEKLEVAVNKKFIMKYKVYDGGPLNGIDLRTKYPNTQDNQGKFGSGILGEKIPIGRESYYDRINRYVAEGPTNAIIYEYMVNKNPTEYGAWSDDARQNAMIVSKIMRDGEAAAMQRITEEDLGLKAGYLESLFKKAEPLAQPNF